MCVQGSCVPGLPNNCGYLCISHVSIREIVGKWEENAEEWGLNLVRVVVVMLVGGGQEKI